MPTFVTPLPSLSSYSSLFPSLSCPQAAPFNIIFSFLHPQTPHRVSCLLALLDTHQRASLYTANLEFVFKTSLIGFESRIFSARRVLWESSWSVLGAWSSSQHPSVVDCLIRNTSELSQLNDGIAAVHVSHYIHSALLRPERQ